jgi:predicted N-acetyltransferase YhbS
MKYEFSYYNSNDFDEIEEMIIRSYQWEYPIFGLSRFEFCSGLHPKYTGVPRALERAGGVFRKDGKIVGCALNEVSSGGDAFFLFDSKENSQNEELIEMMIFFAQTGMSQVEENGTTRFVKLRVPAWNPILLKKAEEHGFCKEDWSERTTLKMFDPTDTDSTLPEGYRYADGNETPDFFLSNTHMASFNNSFDRRKLAEEAFHDLRKMKSYDPVFDLCILDPWGRPVAMAILWYQKGMPYCELEPLGVAWWERRKGLGTRILNEAFKRLSSVYPECKGMTGGDQPFYKKIGYESVGENLIYAWKTEIYPSWEPRSEGMDYRKNL